MFSDEINPEVEQIAQVYGFLNQARLKNYLEVDRPKFWSIMKNLKKINMEPVSFFF